MKVLTMQAGCLDGQSAIPICIVARALADEFQVSENFMKKRLKFEKLLK